MPDRSYGNHFCKTTRPASINPPRTGNIPRNGGLHHVSATSSIPSLVIDQNPMFFMEVTPGSITIDSISAAMDGSVSAIHLLDEDSDASSRGDPIYSNYQPYYDLPPPPPPPQVYSPPSSQQYPPAPPSSPVSSTYGTQDGYSSYRPNSSVSSYDASSMYEPITPRPPSQISNYSIVSGGSAPYSSYYSGRGKRLAGRPVGKEAEVHRLTDLMAQNTENSSDPEFYAISYKRSYDSDDDDRGSTKKTSKPNCSFGIESHDETLMKNYFLQLVKSCPNEFFLKFFLIKLQDMSDLNSKELKLLLKVMNNSQQVICNNLPPQMQILFKDRMVQKNAENNQASRNAASSSTSFAARPRMPQGGQSTEDMSNKFVNDINELLFESKKAFEISSSDNLQTHSSVYDSSPNIAPASSQYSGSKTANFLPPPSFQHQSSNFVPPPANFPSASNNFPPPLNEFSSQTNNARSDFISKSNNAISTYSSYAPYDTSSPSSGIPGLTLIERDKPQNQNFSQYKWLAPTSNNRD